MSPAIPEPYSAKDVETFAYTTIKDRLPTILVKTMDTFHRTWSSYLNNKLITSSDDEKEAIEEESKSIVGQFSKLRYELMTNKRLEPFPDETEELRLWNRQLAEVEATMPNGEVNWFEGPWLFVEAYMYRKIRRFFETSKYFTGFDPFDDQKREALITTMETASSLAEHLSSIRKSPNDKRDLQMYLELSLWGNKCDLSLSNGVVDADTESAIEDLGPMRKNILHSELPRLVDHLLNLKNKNSPVNIGIVLDNAGFELFTDMCMAEVLTRVLPETATIRFYTKDMPWFVSDAMKKDFMWIINHLQNYEDSPLVQKLGNKWQSYLEDNKWVIVQERFWTLGYDYARMRDVDPKLYKQLSDLDLLIFKGDLNYRKLTGDLKWERTTPFEEALRGFKPTNVCSLRTIKADVVVGLESESLYADLPQNWMISGEYGLIQLAMV